MRLGLGHCWANAERQYFIFPGRVASGGALSSELLGATHSQSVPIRTVTQNSPFQYFFCIEPVHQSRPTQVSEIWVEPAQPKFGKKPEVGILGQFWAVWKRRVEPTQPDFFKKNRLSRLNSNFFSTRICDVFLIGILFASTEPMYRPRSDSNLYFDLWNS